MSFESDEKKLKKGMEVVEKLNFLSKAGSGISDDFRAHTIENLFGTVWTRPGLEIEERSMMTLAGLIALVDLIALLNLIALLDVVAWLGLIAFLALMFCLI